MSSSRDRAERGDGSKDYAVDEESRRDATLHEAWQLFTSDFGNDILRIASIGGAVFTFEPTG